MIKPEKISKLSRVLVVYHLLVNCRVISMKGLMEELPGSKKTLQRDIALIKKVGVSVRYSRKRKGYILTERKFSSPDLSGNSTERRVLKRLRRLFYMIRKMPEEDCDEWYRETFPKNSRRTMQRDFAALNDIGYGIHYARSLDDRDRIPIGHYGYYAKGAYGLEIRK